MASYVLFPTEQLWEESWFLLLHSVLRGELLCGQGLQEEATERQGCKAGALFVSMEETAEYRSSSLFYECLYLQCRGRIFKKGLQYLHWICHSGSSVDSCPINDLAFPFFFLSARLLSMSEDVNLKHPLYGAWCAYWKKRSLFNEKG